MPKRIEFSRVAILKTIIDRKDWIRYLVLVNWHAGRLGNVVKWTPNAAFSKFVEGQVRQYLDGKAPPAAIETAVMNIADAYLSGQDVTVRAGDYIALQKQFRSVRR